MRLNLPLGAAATVIALALAGCATTSDTARSGSTPSTAAASSMSTMSTAGQAATSRTGAFQGRNGKTVAGTVEIGQGMVVLAGFSSDEGPDLHIYLTNGDQENDIAAGKELGSIAFDKTSQTFSLSGLDAAGFSTVVIHCDKAKAVFGAATLK